MEVDGGQAHFLGHCLLYTAGLGGQGWTRRLSVWPAVGQDGNGGGHPAASVHLFHVKESFCPPPLPAWDCWLMQRKWKLNVHFLWYEDIYFSTSDSCQKLSNKSDNRSLIYWTICIILVYIFCQSYTYAILKYIEFWETMVRAPPVFLPYQQKMTNTSYMSKFPFDGNVNLGKMGHIFTHFSRHYAISA